ncbi:hypothetical protein BX661DRAFT_184680 [Kickxella alabastrina]|uniref:uncharacterized protein n=1 Tax=Kickxella alabastrina TaxID=61397 RepID=UPI002221005E|nr:uncharacterized protein BX661DRAFT_184680 [Kickxella alabastrina]KAI7825489.1 hypothetical protein BX661DRAFT_184680 [Kickxella alabastrina]
MNHLIQKFIFFMCFLFSFATALPAESSDASAHMYKREMTQETRDNYLKAGVILLGIITSIHVLNIIIGIVAGIIKAIL